MNDFRRRPFLPGEPPMPSHSELFRQAIEATARGRAKQELKQEAKDKAREINRPQQPVGYERHDDFAAAQERWRLAEEIGATLDAEHAAKMRAIEKHFALKRQHIRMKEKIRKILGDERFNAARAEARRRRNK
jgi:hypothetical protein